MRQRGPAAMTTAERVLAAVLLSLLALIIIAQSYRVGDRKGFNRGWDKGYIRGLENCQNVQYDLPQGGSK